MGNYRTGNMKLTKKELIDFETELNLIEKKVKYKLSFRGIPVAIAKKLGISPTQISEFRHGIRKFSLKRLLKIARLMTDD